MENKELLYTSYRLRELERLLPEGLPVADLQRVQAFVDQRDDEGLIAFLEGLPLAPDHRERLRIIKAARPIALKIVALWREMPLRHEEIEAYYKQLQALKAQYDRFVPGRVGAQLF